MTIRTLTRAALAAVTATTAALVLTACGGDGAAQAGRTGPAASADPSVTATGAAHNAQDVSFAQGMIPHHRQALEMARLAADRASSPQVKDLASRIEKAQDPEITEMTGWLRSWGEDVTVPGTDHSGHAGAKDMKDMKDMKGGGTAGMKGMMSAGDMDALEKAEGEDFDRRFLTMMVGHHRGAVEMATTERRKGAYAPATALADAVVTGQSAEIAEMRKLLDRG
ncbi:DUF305 domain-containing protein [Streptomyces sp. NPDC026672]|uniref:DUF305 domain-containing protein n=1 Tax=unclassified Streptomyces TaxID=2593676 RepID=UPI0033F3C695